MLRSPLDVPCSVCKQPAGAPCVYAKHPDPAYRGCRMPGYHSDRKYIDFLFAKAAVEALTQ